MRAQSPSDAPIRWLRTAAACVGVVLLGCGASVVDDGAEPISIGSPARDLEIVAWYIEPSHERVVDAYHWAQPSRGCSEERIEGCVVFRCKQHVPGDPEPIFTPVDVGQLTVTSKSLGEIDVSASTLWSRGSFRVAQQPAGFEPGEDIVARATGGSGGSGFELKTKIPVTFTVESLAGFTVESLRDCAAGRSECVLPQGTTTAAWSGGGADDRMVLDFSLSELDRVPVSVRCVYPASAQRARVPAGVFSAFPRPAAVRVQFRAQTPHSTTSHAELYGMLLARATPFTLIAP